MSVHEQRWNNRIEMWLYTFFLHMFCWQYLLIPVGIRATRQRFGYGDYFMILDCRQLHIFGLRVARWVKDSKFYHEPLTSSTEFTRVRPKRRKLFRAYRRRP